MTGLEGNPLRLIQPATVGAALGAPGGIVGRGGFRANASGGRNERVVLLGQPGGRRQRSARVLPFAAYPIGTAGSPAGLTADYKLWHLEAIEGVGAAGGRVTASAWLAKPLGSGTITFKANAVDVSLAELGIDAAGIASLAGIGIDAVYMAQSVGFTADARGTALISTLLGKPLPLGLAAGADDEANAADGAELLVPEAGGAAALGFEVAVGQSSPVDAAALVGMLAGAWT